MSFPAVPLGRTPAGQPSRHWRARGTGWIARRFEPKAFLGDLLLQRRVHGPGSAADLVSEKTVLAEPVVVPAEVVGDRIEADPLDRHAAGSGAADLGGDRAQPVGPAVALGPGLGDEDRPAEAARRPRRAGPKAAGAAGGRRRSAGRRGSTGWSGSSSARRCRGSPDRRRSAAIAVPTAARRPGTARRASPRPRGAGGRWRDRGGSRSAARSGRNARGDRAARSSCIAAMAARASWTLSSKPRPRAKGLR